MIPLEICIYHSELIRLHTKRRKSETEGEWLKRALENINSLISLELLFESTGGDVIN